MCLFIDEKLTAEAKQRDPEAWVERYKIVKVGEHDLNSIYFGHKWTIGVNKGEPRLNTIRNIYKYVQGIVLDSAIHVYLDRETALHVLQLEITFNEVFYGFNFSVLKVYCQNKDLIAVGGPMIKKEKILFDGQLTEAYTQVTLKEEDYTLVVPKKA